MNPDQHHSRRDFLRGALPVAGAASLTSAAGQVRTQLRVDADALKTLRAKLKGGLTLPTETGYEAARRVYYWNPETDRRPVAVVRCAHVDDVRYAVEFARRHRLEVAVRGGGHSLMGWGTSNGVVLDMTGMNRITIDAARRTGRIEGGVLGGEVMRAAGRHGLAPVLGQCPGVGAAGVTLGGGLGWLSGIHGASSDNLLSASMVAADGRMLSVDAQRNAELWWGIRGAGSNFGVATGLEFRLHPLGGVTSGDIYYPVRDARTIVRFFRDLMAEAPDSFQATLNLTPGERGVFVSLCHAGGEAEADAFLRKFRKVATPAKDTVKRQEFAELAARTPVNAAGAAFRYVATVYRADCSDEVIGIVLDRLAQAPPETVMGMSHYMHGEVCRRKPDETAFPLRQTGAIHMRVGMDWSDPAMAQGLMRWADETRGLLRPTSGERIYANYQTYAGKGSAEAVFGGNYARLAALKRKYDPDNVFLRNSNVLPGA